MIDHERSGAGAWGVTPRQIDVAFVLSSVPGVVEVRAMWPGEHYEFAVQLDERVGHLVAAHYALLRVLSHVECERVLFHRLQLPASLLARSQRIDLTSAQREAAARRVPVTSAALQQALPSPPPRMWLPKRMPMPAAAGIPSALLVAKDGRLVELVQAALGPDGYCARVSAIVEAVNRAFTTPFELLVCAAPLAYGPGGFVTRIAEFDRIAAARIVVIAQSADERLANQLAERHKFLNPTFLALPEPEELARWVTREWPSSDWVDRFPDRFAGLTGDGMPMSSPSKPPQQPAKERKPFRVLVIDDDPSTASFVERARALPEFRILFADDGWAAFDLATSDKFDIAICSANMRMATGEPVYRFIWNVRPASKARFVLIGEREAAQSIPASTRRPRRLIERPLTETLFIELAEEHLATRRPI